MNSRFAVVVISVCSSAFFVCCGSSDSTTTSTSSSGGAAAASSPIVFSDDFTGANGVFGGTSGLSRTSVVTTNGGSAFTWINAGGVGEDWKIVSNQVRVNAFAGNAGLMYFDTGYKYCTYQVTMAALPSAGGGGAGDGSILSIKFRLPDANNEGWEFMYSNDSSFGFTGYLLIAYDGNSNTGDGAYIPDIGGGIFQTAQAGDILKVVVSTTGVVATVVRASATLVTYTLLNAETNPVAFGSTNTLVGLGSSDSSSDTTGLLDDFIVSNCSN